MRRYILLVVGDSAFSGRAAYTWKTLFRNARLAQAFLAKAFRGELVPTEAELAGQEGRENEPAWVLLERVRRKREEKSGPVETTQTPRKPLSP